WYYPRRVMDHCEQMDGVAPERIPHRSFRQSSPPRTLPFFFLSYTDIGLTQPARSFTCSTFLSETGPRAYMKSGDVGQRFQLESAFAPTGDQPRAIAELTEGLLRGDPYQVLLGATGTGKSVGYDDSVF